MLQLESNYTMTSTHKSYILIENILQLIEKYGVDEAITKIKLVSSEENDNDILIAYITTSICNHFKITKEELLIGTSRKDQIRVQALSILCFMLYSQLNLSQNNIAVLIGKDKTRVCRYIKYIKTLDPKFIYDKEVMENKHKIELKIKTYLKDGDGN